MKRLLKDQFSKFILHTFLKVCILHSLMLFPAIVVSNNNEFSFLTSGGINKFHEEGGVGRDGYYGWHGYGGSVFQWYPEHRYKVMPFL